MKRLDVALTEGGFTRSRTQAVTLIAGGLVTVNGSTVMKASHRVQDGMVLAVVESDSWVSRGAHKLIAALDAFGVDPTGRLSLDAGSSTGGFTQVLLKRGARKVLAFDVGHGQLAPSLANDVRVVSVEGFNIRDLTQSILAKASGEAEVPTLVTADLSFISLTNVLPALRESVSADADFLLLVKPQFEVGRTGVHEGIVRDPALRSDAISKVLWAGHDLGLLTAGVISSPIPGTKGNREYLVYLSAIRGTNPTEWMKTLDLLSISN